MTLEEYSRQLRAEKEAKAAQGYKTYMTKNVECETPDGDIEIIRVIDETGRDKDAIKQINQLFPSYEIIDVTDGFTFEFKDEYKNSLDIFLKGYEIVRD